MCPENRDKKPNPVYCLMELHAQLINLQASHNHWLSPDSSVGFTNCRKASSKLLQSWESQDGGSPGIPPPKKKTCILMIVCVCVWVKSTFGHFDEYAFCDICCFFVTPSVPRSLDVWYQLCVGVKVLVTCED
jgi:hypothetical protein